MHLCGHQCEVDRMHSTFLGKVSYHSSRHDMADTKDDTLSPRDIICLYIENQTSLDSSLKVDRMKFPVCMECFYSLPFANKTLSISPLLLLPGLLNVVAVCSSLFNSLSLQCRILCRLSSSCGDSFKPGRPRGCPVSLRGYVPYGGCLLNVFSSLTFPSIPSIDVESRKTS